MNRMSTQDLKTRMAAARNPNITSTAALELAQDSELDVQIELALNTHMDDARVLKILAASPSVSVREVVARHPTYPTNDLATDRDWRVRASVASNHSTNPRVLVRLLNDEDETVRRAAQMNPTTPEVEAAISEAAE